MSDSNDPVGFVAPDPADLAPFFPGYEIQSLIATGGMGAVYCAVQKSLDRTVALKILPVELSKDAAFCAGFEAEAKAMARLNHPNLIGVYDFGEVNGMLYIIMEYVPGQSIYHSAYGIKLAPQEVIRLVTGICNGLAHAHENGILHRDIKPANILLDLNAEPKIGDFGLARPVGSKIEEGEEIFGTPHYTAPEVVDDPHSVDYRADIFSVGVLLHELLTSKLPADDTRPASVIAHCDPRFDTIIRKATQPLPAARYSSAMEIARDLQAISSSTVPLAKRGPTASVQRPSPAGRHSTHRHPLPKKKSGGGGIVVFLIIAAVAGGAAFVYNSKKPLETTPKPTSSILPTQTDPAGTSKAPESDGDGTLVPEVPPVAPQAPDSTPFGKSSPTTDPAEKITPDAGDDEPEVAPQDGSAAPTAKADVNAFFVRARDIMRDKAKVPIAARKLGIKENFSGFGTNTRRQLSRYKPGQRPEDDAMEDALAEWRDNGGIIPEEPDIDLAEFPELSQLHAEYLLKQTGVIDTYNQELSKLSALYVIGLQKQAERYLADGDVGAAHLVEKEIATNRDDPDHFATVVLGLAPEIKTEAPSDDAFGDE